MKFSPVQSKQTVSLALLSCLVALSSGCGSSGGGTESSSSSADLAAVPEPISLNLDEKRRLRQILISEAPPGAEKPTQAPTGGVNRTDRPPPAPAPGPAPIPPPVVPPAPAPGPAGTPGGASLANCAAFPANHILNTPIDTLPVHSRSASYISSIGPSGTLRADFGAGLYEGSRIGIPITYVEAGQPKVPVSFDIPSESDPGPYPIPSNAAIEGGSDRHVLVVDKGDCKLYEMFSSYPQANGAWSAYGGAVFDLKSNRLRPDGWSSTDAAGLPIAPLLVRYDEVARGEINHAIRFTATFTQRAYTWPARHYASYNTNINVPPMGTRLRLKANFDISGFHPDAQVILRAIKKYGLILADNGANWFISGEPNENWNMTALAQLRQIPGSALEVVDTTALQISSDSGEARRP
jgi:hypothetical protein